MVVLSFLVGGLTNGNLIFELWNCLVLFPLAQLGWDGGSLDDQNAGEPHSVTRSHLSVHLLNNPVQGGVTVLLVHVVVASTTLVSEPDTVVLNGGWVLLKNLIDSKHLSIAFLHFLKLPKEVPELGLGADFICSPELNLGMLIIHGRKQWIYGYLA
uniref:Uncharacterized protein n=1 Tax=Kalanchoe fedtschenkoi TaxID=63787 RepID=A0A7N0T4U6_KALFE